MQTTKGRNIIPTFLDREKFNFNALNMSTTCYMAHIKTVAYFMST